MKIRRLFILHILFGFYISNVYSQQNTIASGSTTSGSNGTVSYSIGQIDYSSNSGSNGTVSQGVQQPFEIITLGQNDFPRINLLMKVYPNPTIRNVILNIGNSSIENLTFQLFDINGKEIKNQKIKEEETEISIENLASAIYFLNVYKDNKNIKSFKIIKNN